MAEERSSTAEWLSDEDLACFEGRLSRLDWLAERAPPGEFWTFPGGLLAKSVFEESRYCFVYGQFIATTLLGLAYVERTLAALFYGAGRNDLERASFARLLKEARKARLISEAEFEDLERIRESRNSYAHFRKPVDTSGVESRALRGYQAPYEVIEEDAMAVIAAALRMVARNAI